MNALCVAASPDATLGIDVAQAKLDVTLLRDQQLPVESYDLQLSHNDAIDPGIVKHAIVARRCPDRF